jgi:hypothetical protein
VKVARIEIKDLQPPPDITNAMARQMKAERERRAVITEADGEKQAAITVAEGQKQSAILQAEGRKEGRLPRRRGPRALAAAEAKATELVSDAIAAGDVNAINYFVAQKYVEAFGKLADSPQQKTGDRAGRDELAGGLDRRHHELVKSVNADRRPARAAAAARAGGAPDGGDLSRGLADPTLPDAAVLDLGGPGGGPAHHRDHHRLGWCSGPRPRPA